MSNQIWSRIKLARMAAKLTQQELADRLGVDRASVSQWESGTGRGRTTPRPAMMPAIAQVLDVQVGWLMAGEGHAAPQGLLAKSDGLELPDYVAHSRAVVVKGSIKMNKQESFEVTSSVTGIVSMPTTDPKAYALRVAGDDLRPRIKAGEFLLIEPSMPYISGDEVFLTLTDGRVFVYEFAFERDARLRFESLNDSHPAAFFDKAEIASCHRVAAIVNASRFSAA